MFARGVLARTRQRTRLGLVIIMCTGKQLGRCSTDRSTRVLTESCFRAGATLPLTTSDDATITMRIYMSWVAFPCQLGTRTHAQLTVLKLGTVSAASEKLPSNAHWRPSPVSTGFLIGISYGMLSPSNSDLFRNQNGERIGRLAIF